MKRESMEENEGILAAILAQSDKQQINVEDLVDLGEPYSGYNRSIPILQ
jgi:anthranilate phosphoribosyltransferase